jgi:hypothetical protein
MSSSFLFFFLSFLASALKSHRGTPEEDILNPFVALAEYGVVDFDHSVGYDPRYNFIGFKKSGIYLIEFKHQTKPYHGGTTEFNIYTSTFSPKYSFSLYTGLFRDPHLVSSLQLFRCL